MGVHETDGSGEERTAAAIHARIGADRARPIRVHRVEEPAAAIGTASIACQFGQHATSPGEYDATSGRYLCRTPAHSRPESVALTITLDGAEFLQH